MLYPIYRLSLSEPYAEAEVSVDAGRQLGVPLLKELLGGYVGCLDRLANHQVPHADVYRLEGEEVCLLLGVGRVYQERATSHDVHISVLAAYVHVDGL